VRVLLKIAGSLIAWVIATLIAAAGVEIAFGVPRPGVVPLVTLVLLSPILFLIWRPRRS
jgi:hypothetical protein